MQKTAMFNRNTPYSLLGESVAQLRYGIVTVVGCLPAVSYGGYTQSAELVMTPSEELTTMLCDSAAYQYGAGPAERVATLTGMVRWHCPFPADELISVRCARVVATIKLLLIPGGFIVTQGLRASGSSFQGLSASTDTFSLYDQCGDAKIPILGVELT